MDSNSNSKIENFFESVGSFFTGGGRIPWCERDYIIECGKEVEKITYGDSEEKQKQHTMKLSWALVHSRQAQYIKRGIAMLEDREKLYLLAVGYYQIGDYSMSKRLVQCCLKIQPDWSQALVLKKTLEDKIFKDRLIGMFITATAIGLIAEELTRKK